LRLHRLAPAAALSCQRYFGDGLQFAVSTPSRIWILSTAQLGELADHLAFAC